MTVHLPGTACTGTLPPSRALTCKPDESPWREGLMNVGWVEGRNFLNSPDLVNDSFYTVASLGPTTFLTASTNGALRIIGQTTGEITDKAGSDIAGITTACASAPAVLVTSTASETDAIQAVEINGSDLRPISERITLGGPVAALWTAENASEASLVVHNIKTGEYEASRLALVCSH